ncbi:MAG: hypothetical protein FD174_1605 [Geobacteraceae bacterium]|nr:MAG: hypothetical protein FD174_1605 [Geobacteraceae bacterium]
MKSVVRLVGLGGMAILILLDYATSHAEEVPHHGLTVTITGNATDCLACHDGSMTKTVPICTVKCELKDPHTVDKPYPPAGQEQSYVPAERIAAAGIILVNGQVTCISCHDLKNPNRHHLVIENDKSRLCFTCHIK